MFGLFNKPAPVAPPPSGSLAWLGVKTMNDDLFDLLLIKNPAVIIAWLLIAIAPRWKGSYLVAQAVGVAYAILYVALFIDGFYNPIDMTKIAGGKFKTVFDTFYSLEGIHALFSIKSACFGGWVHYVVFDLWTGMWIARDSVERKVPQLLLIPSLFFTLMLGPSGLVLYFVVSAAWLQLMDLVFPADAPAVVAAKPVVRASVLAPVLPPPVAAAPKPVPVVIPAAAANPFGTVAAVAAMAVKTAAAVKEVADGKKDKKDKTSPSKGDKKGKK